MTWDLKAACRGADSDLFFDCLADGHGVWPKTRPHVEVLHNYCDVCPERRNCLKDALRAEDTAPMANRFGIRGALTPAQRYSVHKRGAANCPECLVPLDPICFRTGELECAVCKWHRTVQPIPEDGDEWQERHTILADRVLDWMVRESHAGEQLPSPHALAKTLDVRKADVGRVYEAFLFDKTIRKQGVHYFRKASDAQLAAWSPPHLAA